VGPDTQRGATLQRLLRGGGLSRGRQGAGLLLVAVGLPLLTAVLVGVRPALPLESVLLLYLLAVVGGVVPALSAAVASFLLANWFLTPPFRTLVVESTSEVIDLVVFLLVALTVSIAVDVGARRRVLAERRLAEQAARARELAEVDRLRSALLVALGHDLRTPLAGAKAAVSSMRSAGGRLTD
jgi:two-component system sensor histidine kinase KdpD